MAGPILTRSKTPKAKTMKPTRAQARALILVLVSPANSVTSLRVGTFASFAQCAQQGRALAFQAVKLQGVSVMVDCVPVNGP